MQVHVSIIGFDFAGIAPKDDVIVYDGHDISKAADLAKRNRQAGYDVYVNVSQLSKKELETFASLVAVQAIRG